METNHLPKHVAIIMDGNGRWAESRNKKRTTGHKAGVEKTREIVEHCAKLGIQSLTLFAFSSENWARPPEEVNYLMELFVLALRREVKMLDKNRVKLKFIGDRDRFAPRLKASIFEGEAQTCNNDGLLLNIAANYGGRWDILNAVNKALASKNQVTELTEADIEAQLATQGLPQLDLLIRTGGEKRISNFLIWQAAYAELYFSEKLWPDFDSTEMDRALADYRARQRRFGQISAPINDINEHKGE